MNDYLYHILIMVFGVVIAGAAQLLLKAAAQKKYRYWIRQYLNIYVVAGYSIMVLSTICTVTAYKVVPLSVAPACEAFGQVIVAILSWTVLKEKMNRKKITGLSVILLGIAIFFI